MSSCGNLTVVNSEIFTTISPLEFDFSWIKRFTNDWRLMVGLKEITKALMVR